MRRCAALAVLAVSFTLGAATPVRRAGEWEVSLNGHPPRLMCFTKDEAFDQNNLARVMARLPGIHCTASKFDTAGPVISFALQCVYNATTIVSSGTIEQTGPDAFTSKVHSDGGAITMPDGKTLNIPPTDIVNVSHRLGACKPGDHQSPY